MNSATQDIARLQKLDGKLKLVGIANISLLLVLTVLTVIMHAQAVALGHKDLSNPEVSQGIQRMLHENSLATVVCLVCAGLMLLWGPAKVICMSKLQKLSKQANT